MNNKLKDPNIEFLFDVILTLKDKDDCFQFFEDLCTFPELKAMSQRLAVAKMLTEKKVYSEIVTKTGASTATISRVNRSLIYGCDGYDLVFGRLAQNEEIDE
ncbi:MAG: YerC/YecD family TrpR-related protein [Clostridia bacterium]